MTDDSSAAAGAPSSFLANGGTMGAMIAAFDWAATTLGPIDAWPASIRTVVSVILRSPVPIVTLWGEDGIMIYNDAYAGFAGGRHPGILGSKVREGWHEAADFNDRMMRVVLSGDALAYRDQRLILDRSGGPEPAWMNLDYSPVIGEDGVPIGVIAIVVETTGKVRAEQRLSGERDRLRMMFEQAPVFMASLSGPDHVLDIVNASYQRLVGGRAVVGMPIAAFLPEVEAQGFVALLDRVFRTGEPHVARNAPVLLANDQGVRRLTYVDFAFQPMRDEDGTIAGIFVAGYDVTELREAQDRLQIAQRAGHVGTFELYPVARRLVVSEEFCRLWGLPVQHELVLEDLLGMVAEEDRPRVRSTATNPDDVELGYVEYRIRRADTGEERWIARRGERMADSPDRPVRFAGVVYDITDRRRAEEQLRALNERLAHRVQERTADRDRLWQLSTDVMMVADFQGIIHAVNPAWTELFGWSEAELVGRDLAGLVHPDDLERTASEVGNLSRGMRTLRFENRYRARDGSYRWLSWTAVPDASFLHAVGRDIQAERDAQETLEHTQEALRQSQKMEAVGQLTGGIAHDFNNLLTVVTGNLDMAGRALDAAGIDDARSRRAIDNAMKGAERAAALTQRLLAFSRRQPLAPRSLDVDRLVLGMADLLSRALGETIRLEIVTAPGLWRVEADPNQLESAILNLAVNARDAMPGGGELMIETANARIDESYSAAHAEVAPGQYALIAVTDTGTGMSKETIARVFEPFFTTKEVGKGTGLGLSMVYGFVKQSGGHVKVYSEEGGGTTVKIYLPRMLSEPAPEQEAELTPGLEVSQRRETILAVEDDDDVRAYTVECLRELGYRVLEAHDGPSALRLLERQDGPIDLLFTDVVMPGMAGSELAEAARARQPGLKVLYTSGYTRDAIVHGGRLDSGVEMIAKPFTYLALGQKVRDMLDAGRTDRVLVVESEPTIRALALEALRGAGYAVDEAANGAEALGRVRSAQGRYDAVLVDHALSDRRGAALVAELRALYADLPLLLTCSDDEEAIRKRFADDPCIGTIRKPYTSSRLGEGLRRLTRHCAMDHRG